MSQLFHPSSNTIARVSIIGGLILLGGLGLAAWLFFRSPFITRVDVPIEQPVQFRHEQHVGNLGIDCRYCHTSVENSSFAGIPPTHTCMTCHSQVWADSPMLAPVRESYQNDTPIPWVRVHDLPDFTYFNHQAHVAKGVGCETCHGRIDQMPLVSKQNTLYMSWCLECHREPERFVRPREFVFAMGYTPEEDQRTLGRRLVEEYGIASRHQLENCSLCHR